MRVRVDSNWRDISEAEYTQNKLSLVANNGEQFQFVRNEEDDTAIVIQLKDLFLLFDSLAKASSKHNRKSSKPKESDEKEAINKNNGADG